MSDEEMKDRDEELLRLLIGDTDPLLGVHIRGLIRANRPWGYGGPVPGVYYPGVGRLVGKYDKAGFENPFQGSLGQFGESEFYGTVPEVQGTPVTENQAYEKGGTELFNIYFEGCIAEMEDILRRMYRDRGEIEQIKNETRNIIAKLHAA